MPPDLFSLLHPLTVRNRLCVFSPKPTMTILSNAANIKRAMHCRAEATTLHDENAAPGKPFNLKASVVEVVRIQPSTGEIEESESRIKIARRKRAALRPIPISTAFRLSIAPNIEIHPGFPEPLSTVRRPHTAPLETRRLSLSTEKSAFSDLSSSYSRLLIHGDYHHRLTLVQIGKPCPQISTLSSEPTRM